ncbi:hypothetical protein [Pseudoalteromonas luteoviolacea]|uniref:Uncharacterized protein n=1 Tax=Pseudoalteromonas luteoviolacea DSM 6061 TaxID=1365250 RepID=A0A166X9T2_9GAMM|nr:hypothetical protein [Pseudoalteromonas luteoviolacea]KZN39846.1 hypothetical protein N475_13900 [Pseudoalteromonas luteoviolacea DSM 6061]
MDINELAISLSKINEPELWIRHIPRTYRGLRKDVFKLAEPLWIKRLVASNELYVHPNVIKSLVIQNFIPNDLQKKMIWASILASNSDHRRRNTIKILVKKKHGHDWWEEVFERSRNAWAAKERIQKNLKENGPAINKLIASTHLFGQAARDELIAALIMIPEK